MRAIDMIKRGVLGGGVAGDTTPPTFASAEIGTVNASTVAVTFSEAVAATNALTGVTIKVNGTSVTISTGTIQADKTKVYYALASTLSSVDVVTWEYATATGNIKDLAGNSLGNVTAQSVSNNVAAATFAHTYYVRKTGNDTTGNGSTATPWLTLAKAMSMVVATDRVLVGDGTYAEDTGGGTWRISNVFADFVTFQAESGASGNVTVHGASSGVYDIRFGGVSHLKFKFIKFYPFGTPTNAVIYFLENNNNNYITFEDCTFTVVSTAAGPRYAIGGFPGGTYSINHITFTRCPLSQVGTYIGHGLYFNRSSDTMDTIVFTDCNFSVVGTPLQLKGATNISITGGSYASTGTGATYYGILVGLDADSNTYTSTGTISGVVVSAATGNNSHTLLVGAGCNAMTVQNCTITAAAYGIVVKECPNTIVTNNTINGVAATGNCLYNKGSTGSQFTNNTITTAGTWGVVLGKGTVTKAGTLTLTGNHINITGTGGALSWADSTGDSGGGICDSNVYAIGSGSFGNVIAATGIATLTALKAAWAGYGDGSNDSHSTAV